jgi:acetylornithine deacetylase/succinyl-diaminopimelate desuccinylase-like protein
MARVVQVLETEYAATFAQRSHSLLGSPTINVGSIRGGRQPNIVPDQCEILADRRTLPGETRATVRRELTTLFKKHGLAVTIADTKGALCLPMETEARLPLVQQFLKAAATKRTLGVHYFCDASVFSNAGTPSIVFGPGDIAQAHTADEWVAVSELERARAVLVKFLRSLP